MAVDRVLLVGLMGSGKSTVGMLAAASLDWPYLDNDVLVDHAEGDTLEALRTRAGGSALHAAESVALEVVLKTEPPYVAAAAASAIDAEANRRRLLTDDVLVVWLRATAQTLAERLATDSTRPWLDADPRATLEAMCVARDPLFASVADLTLDAADPPAALAAQIVDAVRATGHEGGR